MNEEELEQERKKETQALIAEQVRREVSAALRKKAALQNAQPAMVEQTTTVEQTSAPAAPGGWNRPFRSWEALAALAAVFGLLFTLCFLPMLGLRDDVRDMKASYVKREDVVAKADFESVRTQVSDTNKKIIEFDEIKKQRTAELAEIHNKEREYDSQLAVVQTSLASIQTSLTEIKAQLDRGKK